MRYQIIFDSGALREFDKLPEKARTAITEALNALCENPRLSEARKMTNMDAYRIRVGVYRVIYGIRDQILVVTVVKVAHRKDAYKAVDVIRRRLKG